MPIFIGLPAFRGACFFRMRTHVKICGITSVEDGIAAVEAGADALGFMFYPGSKRHVPVARAEEIIRELPPFTARVGVFVNATRDEIRRVLDEAGLDWVQLHGDEPRDLAWDLAPRVVKAFRVKDAASLAAMAGYPAQAYLLDSFVEGQLGGTGARFNWDLALEAKKFGKPIILAGGLTPENVALAVARARPFGLDVSSGVESAPGVKDSAKMARFVAAARAAASALAPAQAPGGGAG